MPAATPLATPSDYEGRGYKNPYDTEAVLAERLAAASRYIRAPHRAPDIDVRIEAGLIDAGLVTDVVCGMVSRAAPNEMSGFTQFNEGAGPFQGGGTVSNPHGDFYLTKEERKSLGIVGSHAFSIDLLPDPDVPRGSVIPDGWPAL